MRITFNPRGDSQRVRRELEQWCDAPFKLEGRTLETDDPHVVDQMLLRGWHVEGVDVQFEKETVAKIVAETRSCTAAVKMLGLTHNGYWLSKVRDYCQRESISTAHWGIRKAGQWRKGRGKLG